MLRRLFKQRIFILMEIKSDKTYIIALFCAGLIARIAYFFEFKNLLEFLHPTVDALFHHLMAMSIASGAITSGEPFFRAPFYSYFLGLIYFVTGDSIGFARFIQLVIGAFTPVLTFLVARRIFNRTIAIVASLLVLLCGDLVYFEAELLLEFLVVTLLLLTWYFYLRFRDSLRWNWLLLSGLATGLAIITRPNSAVVLPVMIYLLWTDRSEFPESKTRKEITSYLLLALLPIVVVLAHNITRPQPAFTIATQGGVNFYIGNNKDADGVSAIMPGKLGYDWQYNDIKYQAEYAEQRALSPVQVSDYYYQQALHDIAANPGHWLGLEIKKLYLIFSGSDISNNRNLIAFRSQFVTLKFLPVGMAILAPLGLIGMVIVFRRSRFSRGLIFCVLLYVASFVVYFVNSRFRLPALPLLAMLSAATLFEIYQLARRHSYRRVALVTAPVIILLIFLNSNVYRLNFDNRQQALFSKGNLYLAMGDYANAAGDFHAALNAGPPMQQINLNIGVTFLQQGIPDSAEFYFLREDSLFDGSAEALNNLAYLARRKKDFPRAIDCAQKALAVKPYFEEAILNLCYAFRESGFADSAYQQLARFAVSNQFTIREQFLLGILASDLGHFDEATTTLRGVLERISRRAQPLYAEASGIPSLHLDLNPQVRPGRVEYNLGYVLGASGQLDSAIVHLNKAVDEDPNISEAWVNLGSAYFAKHDLTNAKKSLLQAARLNSQSDILMYNLALVSLASNDTTEARAYLQRCLSLNPQLSPAKLLSQQLGQ